jgi:UDPglucose 6-dehydrogenase
MNKIGIIGNGFVGNAVFQNMKEYYPTLVYDKCVERSLNLLEDVLKCDFIFICVPTPMNNAEGGNCNLSILKSVFSLIPLNSKSIFIIKSTVPVGSTEELQIKRSDLKIIHNPEFLTASNAVSDFKNTERNIFGGDYDTCSKVLEILKKVTPNAKNIIVSSKESEAIKYFANTFLATKVAYFNLMHDVAKKLEINYCNLVEGVCSDSRIGFSHSKVPGPDGDKGFGGTCFPKDINALINTLKNNKVNYQILEEIWKYNKEIRNKWDWAENKSAVLKGE